MSKSTMIKSASGILLILTAVTALLPAVTINGAGMTAIDILRTGLGSNAPETFGFYGEMLSAHMRGASAAMFAALIIPVIMGFLTCFLKEPKGGKTGVIGAIAAIFLFGLALILTRMSLSHLAGLLSKWGSKLIFRPVITGCVLRILLCIAAAVLAEVSIKEAEESENAESAVYWHDQNNLLDESTSAIMQEADLKFEKNRIEKPACVEESGSLAGIDQESGHILKLNEKNETGILFDGQEVTTGDLEAPACVCRIRYDSETKSYILRPLKTETIFYGRMKLGTTHEFPIPAGKNIYIGSTEHVFKLM